MSVEYALMHERLRRLRRNVIACRMNGNVVEAERFEALARDLDRQMAELCVAAMEQARRDARRARRAARAAQPAGPVAAAAD